LTYYIALACAVVQLTKNFYSTKSNNSSQKEGKYLSYITPLKQPKSMSNIIPLIKQDKNPFAAMDIETMRLRLRKFLLVYQ
jgi:hypothetical protein